MKLTHLSNDRLRSGTATVEAAVCLPVLLLLVFGAVEASNAIYLKQTATMAAYEAAAFGARDGGTAFSARNRCRIMLEARDISTFDVSVTPESLSSDTPAGTQVTVTVTVPAAEAALGPLWLYEGRNVTHTAHMVRTR